MFMVISIIICICIGVFAYKVRNKKNNYNYNRINESSNYEVDLRQNRYDTYNYYIENNRIYTRVERVSSLSRQARIRECQPNQLLTLKRELFTQNNYRDIAVLDDFEQLGYLSRDLADMLVPKIDRGDIFECVVLNVTGSRLTEYELNVMIYEKQYSPFSNINSYNEGLVNNEVPIYTNNYYYTNVENNYVDSNHLDNVHNNNDNINTIENSIDDSNYIDSNNIDNSSDNNYDTSNDITSNDYDDNNYDNSDDDNNNSNVYDDSSDENNYDNTNYSNDTYNDNESNSREY